MLRRFLKVPLIAIGFTACAAQAQSYLTADGQYVRSASGECLRTGAWTRESAVQECDPQPVTYWAEVLFGFERHDLGADERKRLDHLAQSLVAVNTELVTVIAYTDRIGEAAYNARLSERRAQSIRAYLVEKGLPEKLVRLDSRSALAPVTQGRCDAMGPENRQNTKLIACLQPDRRVEIEATVRHR